jgi:hypothetical protein
MLSELRIYRRRLAECGGNVIILCCVQNYPKKITEKITPKTTKAEDNFHILSFFALIGP